MKTKDNVRNTENLTNISKNSNNLKFLWAYQLQNANIDEIANSSFTLIVIDYSKDGTENGKYSKKEIEKLKKAGKIPIAYISIGEAEDYRFYWDNEWLKNPPEWLGDENKEWMGCYAVKYWHPEWKRIIFKYLDKIIQQGFCGVYLDKVDEFEYWTEHGYDEDFTAKEMIKFIVEIANYSRNKTNNFIIIPQNGERLLEYDRNGELLNTVSGWAVEDLFYDETEKKSDEEIKERTKYLDKVKYSGKFVLVVDYVDDGTKTNENIKRIEDFINKSLDKGYIPYVAKSDRELDELNTWWLKLLINFYFLSFSYRVSKPYKMSKFYLRKSSHKPHTL